MWQQEYSNWEKDDLPEEFIKAIFLHHMKPAVREKLMEKPSTLSSSLDAFIMEACLCDDVLFSSSQLKDALNKSKNDQNKNRRGGINALTDTDKKKYVNPFSA